MGRHEVMATTATAALLHDPTVAEGFTAWLGGHAHVELPGPLRWRPEHTVHAAAQPPDIGRIDVAGLDNDDAVRVVIEAKFGADLTSDQLDFYVQHAHAEALLVLVAPDSREYECRAALARSAARSTLYLSWSDLVDGLRTAEADEADLGQFQGLCDVIASQALMPIRQRDLGDGRRHRLGDFERIVDRATELLHAEFGLPKLYPSQRPGSGFVTRFRYVCPDRGSLCFAIGVRSYADGPSSPIWSCWHRDASIDRPAATARLRNAGFEVEESDDWFAVPLPVTVDVATDATVTSVVEGAMRVYRLSLCLAETELAIEKRPSDAPDEE